MYFQKLILMPVVEEMHFSIEITLKEMVWFPHEPTELYIVHNLGEKM